MFQRIYFDASSVNLIDETLVDSVYKMVLIVVALHAAFCSLIIIMEFSSRSSFSNITLRHAYLVLVLIIDKKVWVRNKY